VLALVPSLLIPLLSPLGEGLEPGRGGAVSVDAVGACERQGAAAQHSAAEGVPGRVGSRLEARGTVTRIVMQLSAAPDGTAVAMLTSATGAKSLEIPASTVTVTGKELFLESRAVSGTFRGTLGADGKVRANGRRRPSTCR
jgi:hypothetical protein